MFLLTKLLQDKKKYSNVESMFFHHQFSKLKESDTRAAEFIGIKESTLMRKATGQSSNKV